MTNPINQGCCACLTIVYTPEHLVGGAIREQWRCTSCGARYNIRELAQLEMMRRVERDHAHLAILHGQQIARQGRRIRSLRLALRTAKEALRVRRELSPLPERIAAFARAMEARYSGADQLNGGLGTVMYREADCNSGFVNKVAIRHHLMGDKPSRRELLDAAVLLMHLYELTCKEGEHDGQGNA